MIGIIYTNKEKMEADLKKTSQLNNFVAKTVGIPRHYIRDVNSIPYTYSIELDEKWAIICDGTNKIENLLNKESEEIIIKEEL